MRRFLSVLTVFLASSAAAKDVKKGSPEYSNTLTWQVGDVVEGFGTVVSKKVSGKTVRLIFDNRGVKVEYKETMK